jgi:threonine dehydrogenase-like Zn-dependent dehydrogenase
VSPEGEIGRCTGRVLYVALRCAVMRATVMYGAGDVRVEDVPDAHPIESTDALVRVTGAGICGSDLWPYRSTEPTGTGRRMGHEAIERVRELTDGVGAHSVLECVGLEQAVLTALEITSRGGGIGRARFRGTYPRPFEPP